MKVCAGRAGEDLTPSCVCRSRIQENDRAKEVIPSALRPIYGRVPTNSPHPLIFILKIKCLQGHTRVCNPHHGNMFILISVSQIPPFVFSAGDRLRNDVELEEPKYVEEASENKSKLPSTKATQNSSLLFWLTLWQNWIS